MAEKTGKKGNLPATFPQGSVSQDKLKAMIQQKAFELYEKRGRKSGSEWSDWFEAERIVRRNVAVK